MSSTPTRIPKLFTTLQAKTAYGLLGQIRRIIAAEPQVMHMAHFHFRPEGLDDPRYQTSCGTVGCVAGWISHLTVNRKDAGLTKAAKTIGFNEADRSDEREIHSLFYNELCNERGGTVAHAAKVDKVIAAFMAKHRARLIATRVHQTW